ncbi:hypothetical protein DQ04_09451000 [Trypanosoma grayi]|uniref:hypothetical protein n=1 Tax=Trypanosoma grayi TaxID=71804 RepID=UPI0004F48C86|nr:hypothetical protein DQ04_09451000 [Trypanosoma grayi]KEG07554.1 hypothetical protein DQ04_09451000 [Trypanosoma grayi]
MRGVLRGGDDHLAPFVLTRDEASAVAAVVLDEANEVRERVRRPRLRHGFEPLVRQKPQPVAGEIILVGITGATGHGRASRGSKMEEKEGGTKGCGFVLPSSFLMFPAVAYPSS